MEGDSHESRRLRDGMRAQVLLVGNIPPVGMERHASDGPAGRE